jgi:hydrogenase-4 component B
VIASIASSLCGGVVVNVAQGSLILPGNSDQALVSMPLLTLLLIALPFVPVIMGTLMKGSRLARRHEGDAWACGYVHDANMVWSSDGFSQPMRFMFSPLFRLREALNPSRPLHQGLDLSIRGAAASEPVIDRFIITPILRAAHWLGGWIQWLQHGDFRVYCLYVVVALVVLLLVTV